jgi:hypothetical protein
MSDIGASPFNDVDNFKHRQAAGESNTEPEAGEIAHLQFYESPDDQKHDFTDHRGCLAKFRSMIPIPQNMHTRRSDIGMRAMTAMVIPQHSQRSSTQSGIIGRLPRGVSGQITTLPQISIIRHRGA